LAVWSQEIASRGFLAFGRRTKVVRIPYGHASSNKATEVESGVGA